MGRQHGRQVLSAVALPDDRAGIVAVIEAESAAWFRGDLEGWAECWVQEERAQHVNARPALGARILKGFDEIYAYFAPVFEALTDENMDPASLRREAWEISVRGDMAWATFDQLVPLGSSRDAAPGRHNQLRILERVGSDWKIVAVFQIPNRIGYYRSPWVRVDGSARVLEIGAGAEEALARHPSLGIVGGRLCARRSSENTGLRAALAEAGELVRQRKPREPVPVFLSGEEQGRFSLCWISIADMMVVVLLDDEDLLRRSIEKAGEIYRLTRAQVRVAEGIAQGHDLSRVAKMVGVQPNTVRIHVRRMFGKVEVQSQPALIRALLSVDAPRP